MRFAISVVLLAAYVLVWLAPIASFLHKGTDPHRRRPWMFTAAAAVWFFAGLFIAAYVIGVNR